VCLVPNLVLYKVDIPPRTWSISVGIAGIPHGVVSKGDCNGVAEDMN
jgi:hypothetical protein